MKRMLLLFLFLPLRLSAQTINSAGGNLTAASASCLSTNCLSVRLYVGTASVSVTLSGTFSATASFEQSGDFGVTWVSATPSSSSATGTTQFNVASLTNFRVRVSSYVSGTVAATIISSTASVGANTTLPTQADPLAPGQISMSPYCNAGNVNNCYNSPANTQIDNTCSWTTGSTTVTCTDAPFTAADTGKNAMGWTTCQAFASTGGTGGISDSTTRTITFASSTTVTLSALPANNSGANACFIWGNADDAAADLIDTAMSTYFQSCPHVELTAGNYWFEKPHFFNNPPGCTNNPALQGNVGPSNFGNIFYSGGFRLTGRGRSATTIYLGASFPGAGACNHASGSACFVRVIGAEWRDFSITGGGNMHAPNVAGKHIIYVYGPGAIQNFNCINFGGNDGNGFNSTVGIVVQGWDRWYELDNSGCGTIGVNLTGTVAVGAVRLRIENSGQVGLTTVGPVGANGTPNFSCYECGINSPLFTPSAANDWFAIFNANAANITCYFCNIQSTGTNTQNRMVGFSNRNAGGVAVFRDSNFWFAGTPGTAANTAVEQIAAGTVYMENVDLKARAKVYADVSGSILVNQGGVTASTLGTGVTTNKILASPSETQAGTCATNAATVTFSGTYSFAPQVVVSVTTSGSTGAQATSVNTTTATIHCNGASDAFIATVTPNPF